MTLAAFGTGRVGGRHAEGRGFVVVTFAAVMGARGWFTPVVVALWGLCAYGGRENIGAG